MKNIKVNKNKVNNDKFNNIKSTTIFNLKLNIYKKLVNNIQSTTLKCGITVNKLALNT